MPTIKNPTPPPVVFDITKVPSDREADSKLTFSLVAADRGYSFSTEIAFEKTAKRAELADRLLEQLRKVGLKAEVIGETVHVHGWMGKDGKLRPAAGGRVTSNELYLNELPKVTGLPRPAPCIEYDLAPLFVAGNRNLKLTFEVTAANNAEPFRAVVDYDERYRPTAFPDTVLDEFVKAGFKAERDGVKIRVYGRAATNMKLDPVTSGMVDCTMLKKSDLPKVTDYTKDR